MKIVSKRMPVAIVTLLATEFLLGLLASLYQELPKGYAKYGVYSHLGFIFFHVLIAVTLTVLAIILLVKTARRRLSARSVGSSIIGLAFIVLSYASGMLFIETGNDLFSLTMGLGFLGAFLPYAFPRDQAGSTSDLR